MSKKHHYVPRSLLRRFCTSPSGDTVYVFDKKTQRAYGSSVNDAGAENYFNSVVIDDQKMNLESSFQDLDNRLAELVDSITTERGVAHLTPADRLDLATLAILQLQRVKLTRTTLMTFPEQLRAALKEHGLEPSEETLPKIDENRAKLLSLAQFGRSDAMINSITSKDWAVYATSPDYPFWISDNPVVLSNVFPYGDLGLASPGAQISWPLGSELLLTFVCPTVSAKIELKSRQAAAMFRSNPTFPLKPINVEYYNSLQVIQSSRFIYGPSKEFSLAYRILKDRPALASVESKFDQPQVGKGRPNKRMGPGRWLVVYGRRTQYMLPLVSWGNVERFGPLTVQVDPNAAAELTDAMADMPHASISLYDNEIERRMMREIILVRDEMDALRLTIRHADPVVEKITQSRVSDGPTA